MLLSAMQTSTDPKVVEAAKYSALTKAAEACPGLTGEQLKLVERLADLRSTEEFQAYASELADCTVKFPKLTESQVKGLFPKIKKMRLPDLAGMEGRSLTYLGWTDPSTNRLFLVCARTVEPGDNPSKSKCLTGIEGRFVSTNKKGVCAFCNRSGETALFTVVAKNKIAHLPDYYKAVGQYICLDSEVCNSRITDVEALDKLFRSVT